MAQVNSGSFMTNASEGRSLTFSWSVVDTNIGENYKKISWALVGSGSYTGYVMAGDFKVVIDGETVYNSSTRIQLWQGTIVASGYKILNHDTYGNKKFTASVESSIYEYAVNNIGSGTWELPTIPRYATVVQSLNTKTETTIKMSLNCDSVINYMWYSTDGGATFKTAGYVNSTSASYTIDKQSNDSAPLSANTTYDIVTRVRRKDSQLTTDSAKLSVTTYDYPYCTDSPSFTIGDRLTLTFYNPLKRTFQLYLQLADDTVIGGHNVTGTSIGGYEVSAFTTAFYASIPNSKSGKYKVQVKYENSTKVRDAGNTYSIRGDEVPTVGTITYADTNTTVTAITGNNQHIVQNQSNLKVTYTKATAKNSASISKYTFVLNGVTKESTSAGGTVDFGKVNSARDLTLTMTVTDSRGLTSSSTKTITMLAHSTPTAKVTLERLNNYEDETYLKVVGSVSSVNSTNTMAIKYKYKESGGSYNSLTGISGNKKYTLSLDKNKAYVFLVQITDAFGSKFEKEYLLDKGVFPLFIDTGMNAVGVNAFPQSGEALRVANGVAYFEDGVSIGGNNITDCVIAQGKSGKWNYRKWASGIAECWGTVTITVNKDAYDWKSGIYCVTGSGGSVLSSVFTSYDCALLSPIYWYQISASGRVKDGKLEANIFGINSSMSSMVVGSQIDVNCIIKGKWK